MVSNPLISIVTPCHNAAETIEETLKSVLAQTYCNWELIIVDDASDDDTFSKVMSFAKNEPRIRLSRTDVASGSPSYPRNIGIERAQGELIAFIDADDVWLPSKLEEEVDFLLKNKYDLVYSFYEKINWMGQRADRVVRTSLKTTYNSLLKSNSIPFLTTLITKSAIGETRFKPIQQEDFCFWLDILKKGYIGYNLEKVTALYRESKNSRSSNKVKMFKGYWDVIRKYQNIPILNCCFYMITYTLKGFSKYLK